MDVVLPDKMIVAPQLTVFPVASLVKAARGRAEKVLVSLEMAKRPYGYTFLRGRATELLPPLAERWLGEAEEHMHA